MKRLLVTLFLLITFHSYGQRIMGTVLDNVTKQPVNAAIVNSGSERAATNKNGEFQITLTADTLRITHLGYKSKTVLVNPPFNTIRIELESNIIGLNEVIVRSNRQHDLRLDSLNNRKEYAKQFDYTGPKVMDAFKGGPVNPVNNTSQILNINLLTLVSALTKKSTPEYKFKQVLIRDEKAEFVDRKFNRALISQITGFKGDSLGTFISTYRPTYKFAQTATDYDMINYIKDSKKKFLNGGMKETDPFVKKAD